MKQIKIIILLLMGTAIVSCGDDFLSPAPTSAITADNFYKNDVEIESGIINMYDGIQGINSTDYSENHGIQLEFELTEMRSDNTKTKSGEGEPAQFERLAVQATNGIVTNYYLSYYNVIYRANTVLDNLGNASDANRAAYEGEAKFVRAYAYFNLVRLFGAIPLITEVISPVDKEPQFTRVPVDQVYELIVSDLTTAAATLGANNYGQGSKAAAQALLAKVYLTIGEYSLAKDLCLDVMGAGYKLEENFKDVFYKEGNKEIIWAIIYDGDSSTDSQNFGAEWQNNVGRSSGLNYVTAEASDFLLEFGGNRTPYSFRADPTQPIYLGLPNFQVAKYLPNGDESLGIEPTSSNFSLAGNDWIVLRYADVLLMYAEAVIGNQEFTSDATALKAFNDVRLRAGLNVDIAPLTKEEVLAERRAELAFENQRWFDLLRLDPSNNILRAFADANGFTFTTNDILLPIPQREINLSQGKLTQNPGY
jgi:hypothetical protein